jgi:hypothetical protein
MYKIQPNTQIRIHGLLLFKKIRKTIIQLPMSGIYFALHFIQMPNWTIVITV